MYYFTSLDELLKDLGLEYDPSLPNPKTFHGWYFRPQIVEKSRGFYSDKLKTSDLIYIKKHIDIDAKRHCASFDRFPHTVWKIAYECKNCDSIHDSVLNCPKIEQTEIPDETKYEGIAEDQRIKLMERIAYLSDKCASKGILDRSFFGEELKDALREFENFEQKILDLKMIEKKKNEEGGMKSKNH